MPTFYQIKKNGRKNLKKRSKAPSLGGCPQKKGMCIRVFWTTPKKPNSANRKITKVVLTNKKKVIAHIPGIGHNLSKHSSVLIRGGRVKDLPGIKYRTIRHKYSLEGLHWRRNGRSKYGGKAFK